MSVDQHIETLREIVANPPKHQQEWISGQLILKKNVGRRPLWLLEHVTSGEITLEQAQIAAKPYGFVLAEWHVQAWIEQQSKL